MAEPRFMFNGDPEAPVIEGSQRADERNIPPAEQRRLKTRAMAVHDVVMAARRWAKQFDEYDRETSKGVNCDWAAVQRVAGEYGDAQAGLREAVRALERLQEAE